MSFSLAAIFETIQPLNPSLAGKARAHLDGLTKPIGSLGRLEDISTKIYCIQEGKKPLRARPSRIYTIAGDHGVVEENVTACPQHVTVQMVHNFLHGGAAINTLCATADIDLMVVDVGVVNKNGPAFPAHPSFISANLAHGTANIAKGPAMSIDTCLKALALGESLAATAHEDGYVVLGTGEMGIGNTTPSTALFCAYLGFAPAEITGLGAGIPVAQLTHKTEVIAKALSVNADAIASADPVAILAALGGLEIAALTGLILGAASRRIVMMIDGFIATAAFVAAWKMAPLVKDYCFFSHASAESGHCKILEKIEEKALLDLGLRLGEGTGAALGIFLLQAAVDSFNNMATLEHAGVILEA